ncbi:hypothetical protein KIN20_026841 [Parelaphostrongylus tenuis]|nr:hypothetical protein KIN20_026841 [Parelaphostrongylus tenuis]
MANVGAMQLAHQQLFREQALERLLLEMPPRLRFDVTEFNSPFIGFIRLAVSERYNPAWLLNRAVSTFRVVVKLVKDQPSCKTILRQLYS